MDRPTIHVVIVNWNSGRQLQECLASFAAISNDDVSLAGVTIVDNASTDGSADGLTCPAPLNVIRNPQNRGFAAACNQGAAGVDADFLLFLNPDTQLMPGSLERPARYLQAPEHARSASSASSSSIQTARSRATPRARPLPYPWSATVWASTGCCRRFSPRIS